MIRAITPLVLFALLLGACSERRSFHEEHNLDFRIKEGAMLTHWMNPMTFNGTIEIDSSEKVNGKHPLRIGQAKLPQLSLKLLMNANVLQRIFLPEIKSDSLTVEITCKSQKLKSAHLLVSAMDEMEQIVFSDSVALLSEEQWATFSLAVPLDQLQYLHLNIRALGKPEKSEQFLWIDRMKLKVGGKSIDELKLAPLDHWEVTSETIAPLSFTDSTLYKAIPELETKRILAIGESVHGSESINKAVFQLIKYQVAHNDCRLILFEMPLSQSLSFNRFIQGDESFTLDGLFKDFTSLMSEGQLKALLLWLKDYNRSAKEKVWLLGMDIDISQLGGAMWLFDYLYSLNQSNYRPAIDSLCSRLLSKKNYERVLQQLWEDEDTRSYFNEQEYAILLHCAETLFKAGDRSKERVILRDTFMYDQTKFLLNLLCAENRKALVYSHLGHAGYKANAASLMPPSFGSYMKREFGAAYSCIGVLAGKGEVLLVDRNALRLKPLQDPPAGSLEKVLGEQEHSYYYLPAPIQPVKMRNMGLHYRVEQFDAITPGARMDGMIFIQDSEGLSPLENIFDLKRNSSIEMLMKNIERKKRLHEKLSGG